MTLSQLFKLPAVLSGALVALLLAAVSLPLQAQEVGGVEIANALAGLPVPEAITADGVGGLVINSTTTVLGQEFFRHFNEFWREKSEGEQFTLTIVERASRRTGNQIAVLFGQKTMYAGFLPYKLNLIKSFTEQAVEKVYGDLIAMALFAASEVDADLGRDEL